MESQQQPNQQSDFCIQQSEISQHSQQTGQKLINLCKHRKSTILKKYSVNTASSAKDEEDQEVKSAARYTPQQLNLTSIELLEQQNNCKIKENKSIYPSSFCLISLPIKKSNVTLKQLMEFNFSVLSYSVQDLIKFATEIIYSNSYAQSVFTKAQMEELTLTIASNYNKTPYHNFSHAFSLMQLNFQCLELMPKFKSHFSDEQIFYTFISGISHDLNHGGTNNMFEVKRKTELALISNNQSVLEKMHISMLWKILKKYPNLNFLKKAQNERMAKQTITKLILSTDMSSHFKSLELLQKRRKQKDIALDNFEDRMFMMEQIFHSCDLGNPTLEYDSYIAWAALLSHQFNQQSKLEKNCGVQVTKSFEYKNFTTLYNDQVWFVGKIVHPLWKQLSLHLPELEILKKRIQQNTDKLNEKLTEEELKART